MSIISYLAKAAAGIFYNKQKKVMRNAVADQEKTMRELVQKARNTRFGLDHHFGNIHSYEDFKKHVPIRDYEGIKHYIELIKNGEKDILWPGKPAYFAKTSGTTSGTKYIPITKESMQNHIRSTAKSLLTYIATTGNSDFINGKMIFLSGSPTLDEVGGIPTGRLSGISNHHVPGFLRKRQVPSYETNCIEDWETKLDKIVEETIDKDLTLIGGIPPWIQMYFDKLYEKTGKKVIELFPNFSVLVYGGVNFEPYKQKLFESIGKEVDSIELFPASEGSFAYQDVQGQKGMLLTSNEGIFYEFVPAEEIHDQNPTRLSLRDVQPGKNYALIINNNAGLWGYNIGDTVKFVSIDPYRLIVSGRTKHYISAFGEHVIGEEVESALSETLKKYPAQITEFTVAPLVAQEAGKSHHQWFIEFEKQPEDLEAFAEELDMHLRKKNSYYDDLIAGNILQRLQIISVKRDAFINYMKSIGKLGGQNKLPRLSNDRKIAEVLERVVK